MSSLYITPSDAKILTGCSLFCYYANKSLEMQFPPKIVSDSRKMNWSEHKSGYGVDPTAHYGGNSGREISIKFEYVVETDQDVLNLWSVARIKRQVNLLKGIFTGFAGLPNEQNENTLSDNGQVLILFTYPLLTGFGKKTFRVSSVSVEYSDEIISGLSTTSIEKLPYSVQGPGQLKNNIISYPLKSTVTMNMVTYGLGFEYEPVSTWELASTFPTPDELWY